MICANKKEGFAPSVPAGLSCLLGIYQYNIFPQLTDTIPGDDQRSITREEFVAMLVKAFDIPSSDTDAGFTDAAADGWYASYLAAAKQAGLVNGYEDGSFGVGQEITREDVTVFLYRAQNLDSTKTEESELFADDADISAYAADAVYALRDQGIISGRGNNEFAPKAPCTRAEAAKMIYSLVG